MSVENVPKDATPCRACLVVIPATTENCPECGTKQIPGIYWSTFRVSKSRCEKCSHCDFPVSNRDLVCPNCRKNPFLLGYRRQTRFELTLVRVSAVAFEQGWVGCDMLPNMDLTFSSNLGIAEVKALISASMKTQELGIIRSTVAQQNLLFLTFAMQVGDRVSAFDETGKILKMGSITGRYEYHPNSDYSHMRSVAWDSESYSYNDLKQLSLFE